MTPRIPLFAALALSLFIPLMAAGRASQAHQAAPANPPAASKQDSTRGERVFKQNCSRCHEAPQGFPPQVSNTILRHMRVRASLSAADEKALMQFMNP